jgi:endo-1,4-beta-D-glucanase Y/4-amino-4-deoxy-L-arabinose transferase-like glycosyltransferase
MKTILTFLRNHYELFIILGILGFAVFAHSYNMFHYPYYEDDEGTYMSQAWAVLKAGKLAPYTYWYDHAPAGWFFIALWALLTGGFFTFGFSVNSGRVLMLVIHVVSVWLLYRIAKKTSGSTLGASIASLIYALSPLGLSFERRVLLDNIMTFWLLLSYLLVLGNGKKLRQYILSAILFGIAVLSKESAIFFLPVFLFVLYVNAHKHHRIFAITKWLSISLSIISLYFLYALVKGELFPTGTLLGGIKPHVSLLDTFHYQVSRKGGFFLSSSSAFMQNFREWLHGGYFIPVPDPAIMIGGIIGTVILFLLSLRKRNLLFAVLPSVVYWLFLIRGGEIIGFYIIPLIPFLALNIGLSISTLADLFFERFLPTLTKPLLACLLLIPFVVVYLHITTIYKEDQTTSQMKALAWVSTHVPKNATLIMDNYAYIEFHDISSANDFPTLPQRAEYYWKADKDPDVRIKVLHNNWKNVDYILSTPQVQYDAENAGLDFVKAAYDNSVDLASFKSGWNVDVRKTVKNPYTILSDSWTVYKRTFISPDGQVTDPSNGRTTSEGESYALLRAVWMNDKGTFDSVLQWTVHHLLREDKRLFAWWYGKDAKGNIGIVDKGTATDADENIALSLLLASKQWHDDQYLQLAQKNVPDIWQYETAVVAGNRYIVAGNWTSQPNRKEYTINPSYLEPYAYRIFAQIDKTHDWISLVNSSYDILNKCSSASLGFTQPMYLPPNWCNLESNGQIQAANNISRDSTNYSYDALRVIWRVALDAQWNNEAKAYTYLKNITLFPSEWKKGQIMYASYAHDGKIVDKWESLLQYSTQLAYFSITDKNAARTIYLDKLFPARHEENGLLYLGDKNDYYSQNWLWFGNAFYTNNLPNLWLTK